MATTPTIRANITGTAAGGSIPALASAHIFVGNGAGAATDVAMSGDISIDNTGATSIGAGKVLNSHVGNAAGIAFSKLASLTSGYLLVGSAGNVPTAVALSGDATLSSTGALTLAALSPSKITLQSAYLIVGDGSNAGAAVAMSGDGTITNAGVFAIASGVIVNNDINASAAIAFSKLAALPDGQILVGSGANVATAVALSGHATIANTGALTLNVHGVTAATATPDVADLIAISDESAGGDPTLAFTVEELMSAAGDVTDLAAAPAVDDRMLVTDESTAGDPARSVTVAQVLGTTAALTGATPVVTAAGTDTMLITDADASNVAKSATLFALLTAAAGDGVAQNATSGALGLNVTGLGTTVAAPSITAAEPDYVAVSDESEAGNPTGKASLFAILTAAAGEGLAQDGTTGALTLAAATQDRIAYPTASSVDGTDGTAAVTVQVKDGAANNLAANVFVRFWTGTANDYGQDAVTDIAVTTGTMVREAVANTEMLAVTDNTGKAVFTVTQAAGTVYGWAEVGGLVAPVTIAITGP